MQGILSDQPVIIGLAALAGMGLLYVAFLFSQYIPHFLFLVYSMLPLFYKMTGLQFLPLSTVFILLFGPVVLLRTRLSALQPLWPVGCYLAIVASSSLLNRVDFWSYKAILIPVLIAVLCYLSMSAKNTDRQLRTFVYVLVTWTVINSAFSILQITRGGSFYLLSDSQAYELADIRRGYGLVGMATQLGITFCLGIPFLAVWAIDDGKRRKYLWIFLGASVFGLILAFSRGAVVGLFTSGFLILLLLKKKKLFAFYLVAALIIALSYSSLVLFLPKSYATFFHGKDLSAQGRTVLIGIGFKMFLSHPILGFGAGGFSENITKFGYRYHIEAHNTYVQVLVEYGVLGLFFFLFTVIRSMKGYWAYIKKGHSEVLRRLSIGGLSALTAILINSTVHCFEWHLEFWLAIMLGFLMRNEWRQELVLGKMLANRAPTHLTSGRPAGEV